MNLEQCNKLIASCEIIQKALNTIFGSVVIPYDMLSYYTTISMYINDKKQLLEEWRGHHLECENATKDIIAHCYRDDDIALDVISSAKHTILIHSGCKRAVEELLKEKYYVK